VQIGAAVGVYWEPKADGTLRLGASYTSSPGFGAMRLHGTFDLTTGSNETPTTTPADLLQQYPDLIRFGGAWRFSPQSELRFDGTWQRWSDFKLPVHRVPGRLVRRQLAGRVDQHDEPQGRPAAQLDDSVKLRLGAATWITPETEIFGSFAWESSPVAPANQDPLIFDSQRLEGTLGARHAFGRHLYASLAYTYVYYLPVTVTNSAYGQYALARTRRTRTGGTRPRCSCSTARSGTGSRS